MAEYLISRTTGKEPPYKNATLIEKKDFSKGVYNNIYKVGIEDLKSVVTETKKPIILSYDGTFDMFQIEIYDGYRE